MAVRVAHKRFPPIEGFKNFRKAYLHAKFDESQELIGFVKMDGSNAAIGVRPSDNFVWRQSRNQILTPENTLLGFYTLSMDTDTIAQKAKAILTKHGRYTGTSTFMIYGEWCGGQIINKNIAIRDLPKQFIVFAMCIVDLEMDTYWINLDEVATHCGAMGLSWIGTVGETYRFTIENDPNEILSNMLEITEKIGVCDPVAKKQDVNGIGEGVVWTLVNCNDAPRDARRCKTKSSLYLNLVPSIFIGSSRE